MKGITPESVPSSLLNAPSFFKKRIASALFVAGGIILASLLLVGALMHLLAKAEQRFGDDTDILKQLLSARLGTLDNTVESLVPLFRDSGIRADSPQFRQGCTAAFRSTVFLSGVALYVTNAAAGPTVVLGKNCVRRPESNFPLSFKTDDSASSNLPLTKTAGINLPKAVDADMPGYTLARTLGLSDRSTSSRSALLVVWIDPEAFLIGADARHLPTFALWRGGESLPPRPLMTYKSSMTPLPWTINALHDDRQVLSDHYSLRLTTQRVLGWQDLDENILFAALLVSLCIIPALLITVAARILMVSETVTHAKSIETTLRSQPQVLARPRDEALVSSQVKANFLAGMTHEIRTPLNAIMGMAELLAETPLSTDQIRYVEVFRRAGEGLLHLVNDVLDLSKVESGEVALEVISFDVRELLEETLDLCAFPAAAKGLEISLDMVTAAPTVLRGDPLRIRQIVLNLLSNAVKFTASGEIILSAEICAVKTPEIILRCAVADSGIGIPTEKLATIFENFTQGDPSTTRRYGGTGLGLAISRRLVELLEGTISVESIVGQGSIFRFQIPLKPGNPHDLPEPVRPALSGKRALVVDDDAVNGTLIAQMLSAAGAQVLAVAGGQEAIAALRVAQTHGGEFDVVLCDMLMPQMDGHATIRALVAQGQKPASIFLLTTSPGRLGRARAGDPELGGILRKPMRRKVLYRAMASLFPAADELTTRRPTTAFSSVMRWRLLLVEDNAHNRLLVETYLRGEPYDISVAENGAQAVSRWREGAFDLILMDVQMPVMDGYAATRQIRVEEAQIGRYPVSIIALTAHSGIEERDRSLFAGCTAFMTKPIKKKALIDLLFEQRRQHPRDISDSESHVVSLERIDGRDAASFSVLS